MGREEPPTETMKASEARAQWSRVLSDVFRGKTRVIVEKSGIPVAAIISAEDLERLTRIQAAWDEPFKALDAMRAAFKGIPQAELDREVAKAVAEARAELWAEREAAANRA